MASFETTAFFSTPPEELWRFVEEHGNEIEPLTFESESALAVGVLNHISVRILGVRVRGVSRTTIWEPPFRCAFESVRPSWPVRATVTEDFEPAGGGTRHSIRYEVTPRGSRRARRGTGGLLDHGTHAGQVPAAPSGGTQPATTGVTRVRGGRGVRC